MGRHRRGDHTDVYSDYSSAFTVLNHSLPMHKLRHSYYLSGPALRRFESYLCGREQRVVLNGKTSGWGRVGSGVPEGSICGPIMLVLFCNDVPTELNSSCLMFADDIKVFRQFARLTTLSLFRLIWTNFRRGNLFGNLSSTLLNAKQ